MKKKKTSLREDVFKYAKKKYKTEPEYLWKRFPECAVLRHEDNRKWYGIIMDVDREKLGLSGSGIVDVLNVKTDDILVRDMLLKQKGCLPAYHMSKGSWISILLDGTVPLKEVCSLVDMGYENTSSKKKKEVFRPAKEWLIPSNMKFCDMRTIFDDEDVLLWKQSNRIKAGDTVFIYVGVPVSAILYKCQVLEADIPYNYDDEYFHMKTAMKLKLIQRYDPAEFTFDVLRDEYGINSIRGGRNVPYSLSFRLNNGEVKY